jgi:hypothetical protein
MAARRENLNISLYETNQPKFESLKVWIQSYPSVCPSLFLPTYLLTPLPDSIPTSLPLSLPTYLPTYLPPSLLPSLLTSFSPYLPLSTYLPTHLPDSIPTSLPLYLPTCLKSRMTKRNNATSQFWIHVMAFGWIHTFHNYSSLLAYERGLGLTGLP